MGLIRSKADGQAGAFQILGAPPFSFKAVDAMWTVSWSYPLKKYGLLSGHRQGAAIQGHMPIKLCGTASVPAGKSSTADAGGGLKIGSSGFRFHRGLGGGQPPTSKRVGIYRCIACYYCRCPKTRVECCLYWCYTLLVIGCQIGNLVEGEPQNVGIA